MPCLKFTTFAKAAIVAVLLTGIADSASAKCWECIRDQSDEVNGRLWNQYRRINQEYREGEISWRQASLLHRDDSRIWREERRMVMHNGGMLPSTDQHILNRQENRVSRQIGR
jgi:hypothetical protein